IQSGKIRTFELTKIFRQALESPIVLNAHRVRQGEFPVFEPPNSPDDLSEFYYIQQSDPDAAAALIVDLCRRRIPDRFSLDPVRDIQVLTPMHKGSVGAIHLNRLLQKALNDAPARGEGRVGSFRPGDKVMHLKNNYQKGVFNGDIGIIRGVNVEKERLTVDFYGREVKYEFAELDELTLAYAITVHKSQGSEYPAVIVPIMTLHYILLQRNLLYTAMTRGKKLVILVGTWRALEIALDNDKPRKRRTRLAQRLAGETAG
ncbi:MAG: ATP-binding domain-containing protein, partial [Desulfobacterales bacterium]|nr:ATP-binding domain-containing protein [Desulfobacterales bacterium]